MNAIIDGIKRGMEKRGADPADVAAAAGMTAAELQQRLNGRRKLKATQLVGICQFLGLELSDLK